MSTINIDSNESEEEEDDENNLKVLASRQSSTEPNSNYDECQEMSNRETQFSGSNYDHISLECFNYNCSAGLEIMVKSKSFTFHKGEEETSLGNEPSKDITLFQNEVKEMLLDTTHNQISENTIGLKAKQDCYSNHSDEVKRHTEDELIFQKGKEEVLLTREQIPSVMEDKFSDRYQTSIIQTQIGGMVPDGCKDIFPTAIKIVVTAYDSNLYDIAHRGSVVTEPIAHFRHPSIQAFTQEECYIQTISSEESKPDDQESLCNIQANKEVEGCINQFDVKALREEIISLSDKAQNNKVQLVMMNQPALKSKLGENLKVTIMKREKIVEAITQERVHLQYQIEKNYKLELRDILRNEVLMKFEQIQKYSNWVRKDGVVERPKSIGNGNVNECERDEQKTNANIVSS